MVLSNQTKPSVETFSQKVKTNKKGYQRFKCLYIPKLDYLCRNLLKMTAVFLCSINES